jgi:uncharacterized protein (DUF1697 family)
VGCLNAKPHLSITLTVIVEHKLKNNKMTTYISILRGINVTGHNMIKMDTLQKIYSDLKFKNIETYIQSGNVIFQDEKTKHEKLEKKITKKIIDETGFKVPIIIRDLDELTTIIKNNPFINKRNEDITKLHVTFLSQEPEQANIENIINGQYASDEFFLTEKTVYLYCPNGYGNSKLTNTFFENKLKIVATTRNWKTINELFNIAKKISNN